MKKKRSNKKVIIIAISLVVAIGVIVGIIINNAGDKPVPVTFAKAELRTITQVVSATGKIQAETKVKIAPEVSGEIVNLPIKEGDTVKKGRLLARINPAIIETQLEQQKAYVSASKADIGSIQASLDNLKTELDRTKELYEKKFVSKQDLDRAQASYDGTLANYTASVARYNSSQASLKETQEQANKTSIYAPIDGIVTSLLVEAGERVVGTNMMSGTEMLTVSDLNVMNAEVDVDENDIVLVKLGDTATIEIDALPDKVYKGYVIEVGHSASGGASATSASTQTTTFSVKIRLLDQEAKLRPGMSCNVDIQTAKHINVVSVPLQAITSRDGEMSAEFNIPTDNDDGIEKVVSDKGHNTEKEAPKTIVFVRSNGVAATKEVKIGISDMGFVEILSGLREGDEVVSGSYQAISKLLAVGTKITEDKGFVKK
ncbi:MAG: efflux RND transporter periplasmic adaptor subunit [Ignavibacteria bacterium]|jgi:HlyD family secretion protein|nr:efflux RND transporter periplasmic adaptor subunit [Ignavibacteria bacterium]